MNSKDHSDDHSHMLENDSGESHEVPDHPHKESGNSKNVETFERKDTKHKAVRRSKTLDRNVSFDKSARGKSEQTSLPAKCQICYSEYTRPKQLPCLHTFCQHCLEKFVNPRIVVQCPTCRKVLPTHYDHGILLQYYQNIL